MYKCPKGLLFGRIKYEFQQNSSKIAQSLTTSKNEYSAAERNGNKYEKQFNRNTKYFMLPLWECSF